MATSSDYVFGITGFLLVHPDKLRCPNVQFLSGTAETRTARSRTPLSQHLSVGGTFLLRGIQASAGWRSFASGKHTDVGRITFHQWLQPDSAGWRGSRIRNLHSR